MLDLDENTPLNKDNITFCGHLASIEIFATHFVHLADENVICLYFSQSEAREFSFYTFPRLLFHD